MRPRVYRLTRALARVRSADKPTELGTLDDFRRGGGPAPASRGLHCSGHGFPPRRPPRVRGRRGRGSLVEASPPSLNTTTWGGRVGWGGGVCCGGLVVGCVGRWGLFSVFLPYFVFLFLFLSSFSFFFLFCLCYFFSFLFLVSLFSFVPSFLLTLCGNFSFFADLLTVVSPNEFPLFF